MLQIVAQEVLQARQTRHGCCGGVAWRFTMIPEKGANEGQTSDCAIACASLSCLMGFPVGIGSLRLPSSPHRGGMHRMVALLFIVEVTFVFVASARKDRHTSARLFALCFELVSHTVP